MIISFNSSIFQSQDSDVQESLGKILIVLMDTNIHFIDIKSIESIFYDESGKYIFGLNSISEMHLSTSQKVALKEFLSKKSRISITSLHRQHLVCIVVGTDKDNEEMHPESAYQLIKERSKIIVENGINDWKFIQGICQKYSSGKTKRRSIYQLVDKAIRDGAIEPENSGGVGEVIKVAQRWIQDDRYKNIFRYKLMAIFDSDKKDPNELTKHKKKIEYFKKRQVTKATDCEYELTDLILWHVLYKKKIENYIPLNALFNNVTSISQDQKDDLSAKSCGELDFIEYSQSNIGIGVSQIKDLFPKMFLSSFSYHDFEKRCEHHKIFLPEAKECISEMEQILLKIAKIL